MGAITGAILLNCFMSVCVCLYGCTDFFYFNGRLHISTRCALKSGKNDLPGLIPEPEFLSTRNIEY
jgi:hypothetical protein